jgi:excisionase family DNA binding protein
MPLVLLDGHELADRLGVKQADVMRWARVGKVPSIKTGCGRVLFNLDQVVEALRPDLLLHNRRPALAAGAK